MEHPGIKAGGGLRHEVDNALSRMRATGSGKTTTYSTVKYLDSLHRSIYTIEDPVEYTLPFITQVQVNNKLGLGFGEFLRTVLRHDPDIGIIGEIRDTETAENAVRLADTGHLVFGTLHTNDVPSSLTRLRGLGVDLPQVAFL
jgi:type II secretory ATPase GspE/PulE/Tfp pilus assembly ATPase PilB-like protein